MFPQSLKFMNPVLQKWYGILAHDRKELCNSLEGISQSQFTTRPPSGKWSISEIVSHLITADRLSLDYMKKKSQGAETLHDAGWFEEVKMMFFILSQRAPIKYNAPRGLVEKMPGEINLSNLKNEWNTLLLDYQNFLEKIPDQHLRKKIYKHPILGRMDAKLCLQSIHEHYHHHLPQIKRLL